MSDLAASSALAHLARSGRVEHTSEGLTLREEPSLGVALLFEADAARHLGVEAPLAPNTVVSGRNSCGWIAPGQWLVVGEHFEPDDGIDMSDAYCAVTIAGPQARSLLSKSVPIDLRAFGPNSCARTLMGSVPVFLMARGDQDILLLVERGLAHAAWAWLADGASALNP